MIKTELVRVAKYRKLFQRKWAIVAVVTAKQRQYPSAMATCARYPKMFVAFKPTVQRCSSHCMPQSHAISSATGVLPP